MKRNIRTQKEYDDILMLLMNGSQQIDLSKDKKYRIKKLSQNFIIIDNALYLRDTSGLHKKVIPNDQIDTMKLQAALLHKSNHFGQNRLEALCNELFFSINIKVVRCVCQEFIICMQVQPLKNKEKK
ncbi:hypothetical protein DMUE_3588 [Dictyocoela muelleri]|nr:hypothetical protein DMUE_3588 [Dictyocoela muelleri]